MFCHYLLYGYTWATMYLKYNLDDFFFAANSNMWEKPIIVSNE